MLTPLIVATQGLASNGSNNRQDQYLGIVLDKNKTEIPS